MRNPNGVSATRGSSVSAGNNDSHYENLESLTVRELSTLNLEEWLTHSSPQIRYIGKRAALLRHQFGGCADSSVALEDIGVMVALRRLIKHSDRILQGTLTGEGCISAAPGLWNRMMCEWPMGDYGRMLAEYINARGLARGKILELGAGVGHASKLIHTETQTVYIKTDISTVILQMYNRGGILEAFDIDSDEAPYENLNLIFGSNVLHCARSKERTLKNIFRMLAPGGHLVFCEGTPEVRPGHEWCLSPLFGFFDGWWDRGGFLDRAHWSQLVRDAGFCITETSSMCDGRNTLGQLIACRKQLPEAEVRTL
jgi:SAM-dependent methyltransferase